MSASPVTAAIKFTEARDRMLVAWSLHRVDREDMRKLFRYVRTIRACNRLAEKVKETI